MTAAGLIPQPGILDIAPYVGGEAKAPGFDNPIRLASNESALGPSAKVLAAYHAHAAEIFRYPDGHSTALRQALAKLHGIDPARIVCGGGSDDVINLLTCAYAGPGDEVLYGYHGFSLYPIAARTAGATPIAVPEKDLTFDVDATLARVTPRTKLVFIANPNNPTGTFIPRDAMTRLHRGLPQSVLLVIDAAYAEFVMRDDYEPGLELATHEPNVVMTRTFSKIYALGGMRIGWCYGSAAIADVLNRIRNPFGVSSAAQVTGVAAVEDVAAIDRARQHNDTWRAWLTRELTALGLTLTPSVANFVLARFPGGAAQADAAWDYLREHGILVRKVAVYHLPDCLRITIGKENEMRAVVAALTAFFEASMSELFFERVAFIGIGHIGSSLARLIRREKLAGTITVCDRQPEARAAALRLGLAEEVTEDAATAVAGADLVVIATPLSAYAEIGAAIAPGLKPGAIVTDVGSVKELVVRDFLPLLPPQVHLVPGHPVAGTENSGPESGFAEVFQNRWCILTPVPGGDAAALDKITRLWQSGQMQVVTMDAAHHDRVLAITSHVPHLIAYTIVGTATDLEETLKSEVIKFSASGFRDFTRIAASDPVMWRDIFLNNREAVLEVLQRFNEDLTALQRAIRWGEGDKLQELFTRTRAIRRSIVEAKQA